MRQHTTGGNPGSRGTLGAAPRPMRTSQLLGRGASVSDEVPAEMRGPARGDGERPKRGPGRETVPPARPGGWIARRDRAAVAMSRPWEIGLSRLQMTELLGLHLGKTLTRGTR